MHVVARALPGHKPLLDPATAWWLMARLRIGFPNTLAACLMPDHLHLITSEPNPAGVRARLARVLSRLTVRSQRQRLFERVPTPEAVANGKHLERLVRYVHLNPCRARHVDDPLRWPWSTHRGVAGAELDPWVRPETLAEALGRPSRSFGPWLHEYVSGDPSVDVEGSTPPVTCGPREIAVTPLDAVLRAALAATPWSSPSLRRKLQVELAVDQGWHDADVLARAIGITPRSVRRLIAAPRLPVQLRVARLCLGDARLLLPQKLVRPLGPLTGVTDPRPMSAPWTFCAAHPADPRPMSIPWTLRAAQRGDPRPMSVPWTLRAPQRADPRPMSVPWTLRAPQRADPHCMSIPCASRTLGAAHQRVADPACAFASGAFASRAFASGAFASRAFAADGLTECSRSRTVSTFK